MDFSLRLCVQTGSGVHSVYYLMDIVAFYLGVKRPEREVFFSSPSNAKDKNARNFTSTLPHVFVA
jgi:hypothetical protein